MESNIDVVDFDLSTFLERNSDSDSENDITEIAQKTQRKNIISEKINEVTQVQIKNNLSYKATSDALKLMNGMPGVKINLPEDRKTVKRFACNDINYNILIPCNSCDELILDGMSCAECGQIVARDSKKNNFLVHIPFRKILNKYFDVIIAYLTREHTREMITDVDDGLLFKKICQKNPHLKVLAFTLSVDGANVFRSSNCSMWPVQFYLNFLPPNIRYLANNIITSTIYYGRKKPDMTNLLFTVATEFDELKEKLITIYRNDEFWNFLPVVIEFVFDLPARAEVQNFKGPTGKFGCPNCYHPGIPVKNLSNSNNNTSIRYINQETILELRTHNQTVQLAHRVSTESLRNQEEKDSINGVKGNSALLLFDDVDLINSVPTDFMHCILLGVMKDLISIWLGMRRIPVPPYRDYKISTTSARKLLEQRILNMKPHVTFNRKPRSIFEIANFKATELMYLMWYYLRYALVGILPTRLIKNFEKLSASTYILCKKEINRNELRRATAMLNEFSSEFQEIYGKGAVTMNVHLLNHFHIMVENCGPLWSYSMFGFENNVGVLKRFVSGKTDVLIQIGTKYVSSRDEVMQQNNFEKDIIAAYQKKNIVLKKDQINVLNSAGVVLQGDQLTIWRRIKLRGIIYTSANSIQTKSADYFVRITNKHVGKIEFFFGDKLKPKLMLHVYEETFENFHWTEVSESNRFEIYSCEEIEKKMLYFKVQSVEYITSEPNSYGRSCL